MEQLTRRAFVGFCGTGAMMLGLGGAAEIIGGDGNLLRPPGAQDEERLAALCIKCDRCRSVCPKDVISVASIDDGFLNARMPKMDFHKGYCDFCDLCRKVCPTGAIGSFDPEVEKIGIAIVQEDRCIAYFGGCTECYEKCPYEAITLDVNNYPVIDAAACNGCGLCEEVCPALVYRSFSGGKRRGIVVVTEREYDVIGTTVVPGQDA